MLIGIKTDQSGKEAWSRSFLKILRRNQSCHYFQTSSLQKHFCWLSRPVHGLCYTHHNILTCLIEKWTKTKTESIIHENQWPYM